MNTFCQRRPVCGLASCGAWLVAAAIGWRVNCLLQVLDVYCRSSESGDLRYKSGHLKKARLVQLSHASGMEVVLLSGLDSTPVSASL